MEIKEKHIWIIGITLWLLCLACLKIWPQEQSYPKCHYQPTIDLLLLHSDVHRAELLEE